MWSTVARNLQLQRGSPLEAINKAPKRLGHSFSTHLTTATATTTTTTSAANPATTITATRSSDISFDSPLKGLSSRAINKALKRLGYSFLTYLTTTTATTTTTTSTANPATTITATRSSDIPLDSAFKGLFSS
ncbi:hypothetical protein P8C59_007789 [Phyllachora maydis]|uniref:Uncharacterized protein n=1 Tax=Phyllachora maydis TaxID=1825666 RepID=A0AAD9IAX6_9PEZI|nr:hypothetical protein P8C59_007789 [Phyllachora maydis]